MKTNAIVRIIVYSLLAVTLTGILLLGIGTDFFFYQTSIGGAVEGSAQYDPTEIKSLEINWASGQVTIIVDDRDDILIRQSKPEKATEKMYCAVSGDTLKIDYNKRGFHIGTLSEKDLLIHVPKDWACENLEIDGASLVIELRDLTVGTLDLDGADCDVFFRGSLDKLEADGASSKITLACFNRISRINLDGASCALDLTLPKKCGFRLHMDGLTCDLHTALPSTTVEKQTFYGDLQCDIYVSGINCDVTIREDSENPECTHTWDAGKIYTVPGRTEKVYTCTHCGETKSQIICTTPHHWSEGILVDKNTVVYNCAVCGEIKTMTLTDQNPKRHGFVWLDQETRKLLGEQITGEGYYEGAEIVLKTQILTDEVLQLYCDGKFICEATVVGDHWEFYFTMPNHIVHIELRAKDRT